nr:hypothetical protein [Tanacetum cinerariifolium]
DFENQNKDLQDKYDVLKNQTTTFKINNNDLNERLKVLIEKNDDLLAQTKVLKDQLQVKHVLIDTHVGCHEKYAKLEEERYEYMIRYSALFDNDKQHRKKIAHQEVLFDKMSVELVELDKHVRDLKNTILEKDCKISELEECVCNKDLEIKKCLEERLNVCENKLHKMGQTNQTVHMIMLSKDNLYNGRIGIGFEIPSYFKKAKYLRPTLYDEKVIGLGYTLMFLTHFNEALEIEKFKRSRENKIEFAYDYGNLNASYVNEKINFEDDYFQEIINPGFKKINSLFQQTSSLKPYVPNVILKNIINDLEDEVFALATMIAVIAGYGDVVIGSMTIKKVYYVEGLGHNLFSVGQFCDKGLEVAFRKSTCFVRNEDGEDLFIGDRSSNLYTISLNEVASNSSTFLLDKASSLQSWLWHQRKIHRKHHKSKMAFASNKPLYLLHMDLCGPIHVQSINGKRYVLVVVDDYSQYTWVFFLHLKDEASEVIISFIKKTQVNLQLQVQRVRTNNGTKFKNNTLAKFFDEVGISQHFFAARTPQQNGVVERRN